MKVQKRPVEVEAHQWMGPATVIGVGAMSPHLDPKWRCDRCAMPMETHGQIPTLEGWMRACVGDWIVTGVQGERYPVKPDVFALTYETVNR